MPKQETPEGYAEYDPADGKAGYVRAAFGVTKTDIAATGANINTHVPTPEEIAQRKYVRRRYSGGPRWLRWLCGTDEFSPK